jgi:hypothetical protein
MLARLARAYAVLKEDLDTLHDEAASGEPEVKST